MNRIKNILTLLLAGTPLLGARAANNVDEGSSNAHSLPPLEPENPFTLRPLNYPHDNHFAAHRSHSSHGSHRSSSGGGYATPRPQPVPERYSGSTGVPPTPSQSLTAPKAQGNTYQPTDPGRPAAVSPQPSPTRPPNLSTAEKLKLQIMRVQIALTSLGLYQGSVNGVLDNPTKEAIERFQTLKGIPPTGQMSTDTLNSLGVPAVP